MVVWSLLVYEVTVLANRPLPSCRLTNLETIRAFPLNVYRAFLLTPIANRRTLRL
jgi:hypothetical protein